MKNRKVSWLSLYFFFFFGFWLGVAGSRPVDTPTSHSSTPPKPNKQTKAADRPAPDAQQPGPGGDGPVNRAKPPKDQAVRGKGRKANKSHGGKKTGSCDSPVAAATALVTAMANDMDSLPADLWSSPSLAVVLQSFDTSPLYIIANSLRHCDINR